MISVVIPAFNEEAYIASTLESVHDARAYYEGLGGTGVDVVVVDNDSSDATAAIAASLGDRVVQESVHNIARVRNTGARAAIHSVLVFLDADTLMPKELLLRIAHVMRDSDCAGGAVDVVFRPRRRVVRGYVAFWRLVARLSGMALGACQFCRREAFDALGGYDETIFMGEDVDFVWRLRAAARRNGGEICFIRDLRVVASSRRFDQWPLWRTLLMTHPLLVFPFGRRARVWRAWYDRASVPR